MKTSLKMLEQKHLDMLTSVANLALTFQNQEWWKKTEKLNVQVMKIRIRIGARPCVAAPRAPRPSPARCGSYDPPRPSDRPGTELAARTRPLSTGRA